MAPPSLQAIAQRAAIRSVAGLEDVGDISYDMVRSILKKVEDPAQLHRIEIASPHIADHDSELWTAFIIRDIPRWEDKIIEPKNPRSWWKVYRKLYREECRAKEEQEKQLQAAMLGLNKEKEANQAKFVERVIPQGRRSKAYVDGVRNTSASVFGQARSPALQNVKKGKDIMAAIRKQSVNAQQQKGLSSVQPAKAMLPAAKTQIKQAPEGMVRDHTVTPSVHGRTAQAGSGSVRIPKIFVSRSNRSAGDLALDKALREEQAKKEARLRALAQGTSKPTSDRPFPNSARPAANPQPRTASLSVTANLSTIEVGARADPATPRSREAITAPTTPLQSPKASTAENANERLSPARSGLVQIVSQVPPPAGEEVGTASPSPLPSLVRKRVTTPSSIFMPSKKKKP